MIKQQQDYKSSILKVQDIGDEKCLIDFELLVSLDDYQNKMAMLKKKSIFVLMLDRSMSMSGLKLDLIKNATKNIVKKYYNKGKQNKLHVILFDHKIKVIEPLPDFETFQKLFENDYVPGASAVFYKPFQLLNDLIRSKDIQ